MALVACGASPGSSLLVDLPADEGPHDAAIEWWYFNGHLEDEGGNSYSYHFVTFQGRPDGAATPKLLQLTWADHERGLFFAEEKATISTEPGTPGSFASQAGNWSMSGDGTRYQLAFDTGGYVLNLDAVSIKPPIFHQGIGLVQLGPAGETLYYSRPRLEVSGTLTTDEVTRSVTGIAWMDHQWGKVASQEVGWDWTSLQLDDGSELMVALVWNPRDHTPFTTYSTYVAPDGSARQIDPGDIQWEAQGSWTSPESGVTYPMGWRLEIDVIELELDLTPVLKNAEFADSRFVPAAYWEGAVTVTGTKNGAVIGGNGFVELVGYDPRQLVPATIIP